MAKSDRHSSGGSTSSSTALLLQHHHQHQHVEDHIHMVEEYVLDELDLNSLQLFDVVMPPARNDRIINSSRQQQQQQQRHVRRSAELRTVSIIETLSELVSRTDNGHLTGAEHDCDGLCHGAGRRHHHRSNNQEQQQQQQCATSTSMTVAEASSSKLSNGHEMVGRVPTTAMLELSPIAYSWKSSSPAERAQRQRPVSGGDCIKCRDSDNDVLFLSNSTPAASRQCAKGGGGGGGGATSGVASGPAMCFLSNGIKSKKSSSSSNGNILLPTLMEAGGKLQQISNGLMAASAHHHHRALVGSTPLAAVVDNNVRRRPPIRDPNHFMMSTLRSKGRTPDWIAGIFSIARRGNLERLRHALSDMDATLIRNLSDHRGNNLFHVCCCYGHLECLQWLLQRGKQCEDAILDENKYELTPLVCAVKYGKTPCVEWLISNTIARSQLVPPTGSRPLLHWAAKYGQEVILRWLAEYMESNTMDVNVKDGYGNTSLHLAAKHGHATSIKALVTHRCDVSLKNDLGYKASDYAILYGQVACSEYLLSLEACLLMSASVASLDYDLNSAKAEITELKTQFKDVLSCAKKLVKEREELHQHLNRSEDSLAQLNKSIVGEIRALVEENASLREKLNGSSKNHPNPSERMDETIASLCHAMHARWQEIQQRWLPVIAISEIQQKILLAEEKWKRARARVTWDEGRESREHMEVFRDKLTQVQCRATGIRLSDIRSISSSESSLASMEDTMSEYEDRYGQVSSSDPLPCSLEALNSCNYCHDHVVMADERAKPLSLVSRSRPKVAAADAAMSSNTASSADQPGGPSSSVAVPSISKPRKDNKQLHKDVVKNSGPTTSQATCKVLEVIVASNSSDDEHGGDPHLKSNNNRRQKKSAKSNGGVHNCKAELLDCRRHMDDDDHDADNDSKNKNGGNERKGVKCSANGTAADCNCKTVDGDHQNKEGTSRWPPASSSRGAAPAMPVQMRTKNGFLISAEPDLIVGTKGIRNLPSTSATSAQMAGHVNVTAECDDVALKGRREAGFPRELIASPQQQQQQHLDDDIEHHDTEAADGGHDGEGSASVQHSFSPDTSRDSCALSNDEIPLIGPSEVSSSSSAIASTKRRGFLQKLTLRWPSKRKVKSSKKVQEISAEDFRETYLHLRNANGDETIYEMSADHPLDRSEASACAQQMVVFEVPSTSAAGATAASMAMTPQDDNSAANCAPALNLNLKKRSKSQAVINVTAESGSELTGSSAAETMSMSKTVSQMDLFNADGGIEKSSGPPTTSKGIFLRPALSCPSELPTIGKTTSNVSSSTSTQAKDAHGRNVDKELADEDDEEEDDDDDDDDDDNKEESPPEAEQGMTFERPLSLAAEEDASSIHAQAHLPPKRPTSSQVCIKSSTSDTHNHHHYFSRPESSASRTESCSAFRLPAGFPLRKVSSVSTDLLTPVDSMTPSRMSPAPSEVSKTESALLSPSTTESLRQLGRIEEIASTRPSILPVLRVAPSSKAENIKTAHIVDINSADDNNDADASVKQQQQLQDTKSTIIDVVAKKSTTREVAQLEGMMAVIAKTSQPELMKCQDGEIKDLDKTTSALKVNSTLQDHVLPLPLPKHIKIHKEHKAWYELSDDEEILMPETLTSRSGPIAKSSSEEDETYFCT